MLGRDYPDPDVQRVEKMSERMSQQLPNKTKK
jgi:hypothetical protein